MKHPKTLQQAIVFFGDPDRCFEYAKNLRFPDGKVVCPRCNSEKNSFVKTRRLWFCYGCKKQFTIKVNTIMEDSPIGLDKWMTAFWLLANAKNGISSHELGRTIGVTQTTAWFMLQRIREVMKGDKSYKFGGSEGGPVESDETFIGPNPYKMHRSRKLRLQRGRGQGNRYGYVDKTAVFGVLDRELRQVRAKVVPDVKRETLQNAILDNVEHGSTVYTDAGVGFDHLRRNFVHEVVNHAQEYVRGQVHTQSLENFWSLLKRTLRGTYVAVEPFHLDRYINEQVFRFNNRATKGNRLDDSDRFTLAMSQVLGHRLTYNELTGKDQSPRHETTGAGETEVPF
jgi:transposase-like protein